MTIFRAFFLPPLIRTSIWVSIFWATVGLADVRYVHDYTSGTYLTGEQKALLQVAYTDNAMFVDKRTRYTGSWMTRFFGEVKEQRNTSQFLLGKDEIREINWVDGEILVFPFAHMDRIQWIKEKRAFQEQARTIISERYEALAPEFDLEILPDTEKVDGYPCRHGVVRIRLETKDVKKNASSITLIRQDIWVSDTVPGYGEYQEFHDRLARKLGLESARLGALNFALRYWQGSLAPIQEAVEKIRGYPVKSRLSVEARYVTRSGGNVKTVTKTIKTETMALRDHYVVDSLDRKPFEASREPMKIVMVR